jgi:hypothetical protein
MASPSMLLASAVEISPGLSATTLFSRVMAALLRTTPSYMARHLSFNVPSTPDAPQLYWAIASISGPSLASVPL